MKRGTSDHPKVDQLMTILDIPRYAAVGLVSSLWDWAGRFAHQGDVGKYSNQVISRKLDWQGNADDLIAALVDCKWLDVLPGARLYIHDWHEHCEDYVHSHLARSVLYFANGIQPKLTKLSQSERITAVEAFAQKSAEKRRLENNGEFRQPTNPTQDSTNAEPSQPSTGQARPKPEPGQPKPRQATGISANRTLEVGAASSSAGGQPSPRPKIRNINSGDSTCEIELNGKLERMPIGQAEALLKQAEDRELAEASP